ncbi:MAG: hypothetical protein AAFO94_13335, partial [Bacteroidota bacterium]
MNRYLLLLLCLLGFRQMSHAQNMTWKQHAKTAEELLQERKYKDAAEQYEMAWRRKTDKLEYLMQSGEAYLIVRDFRKAAEVFRIVRDRTSTYPMAGFRYGQCLKQQGKYKEALVAFRKFKGEYGGVDKAAMEERVKKEIEGCELAKAMKAQANQSGLKLEHLSANVNTLEAEFAPIPFSEDILYFSSTMAGKANIYRSQRKAGQWTRATVPQGLPKIDGEHFCNGAFAPDLSRFYFTICKSNPVWGDLSTQCEIHVILRKDNEWSQPIRLPDYVNETGKTTTHPHVVFQEGKEIVYFSSNREGGKGGMDIWYMERELDSEGVDFSFPANAGMDINTPLDEVTPFYSTDDGMLFFSSNGKVNIGGFDIYKASGNKAFWEKPQILAYPVNSSADDYFYRTKPNSLDGFFVSNRTYGMEKITTTQEDIFAFYQPVAKAFVSGVIQDKLSKKPLDGVQVSLYELIDDEHLRLLEAKVAANGQYEFGLIPNRRFRVEARKAGYETNRYEFETDALESLKEFGQLLLLQKMAIRRSGGTPPIIKESNQKTIAGRNKRPASPETKTAIITPPPVQPNTRISEGEVS